MAGDAGALGCVFPAATTYPAHCLDNTLGNGETDVDCGGGCVPCRTPILTLQYMSVVADASTNAPRFRLLLTYVGKGSTALSDIRIRYYFNHNGVTEPVIPLDTQATLDPGGGQMDIADKVSWSIHRLPLGPPDSKGNTTDSYLEINFGSSASLNAGAKLDLTQDIVAGSADTLFDQTSHYSFLNVGGLARNDKITVYDVEQRILGVEPPLRVLPDCAFAAGVNLGGPSVTIDDQALEASASGHVYGGSLLEQRGATATVHGCRDGYPTEHGVVADEQRQRHLDGGPQRTVLGLRLAYLRRGRGRRYAVHPRQPHR
jgi:hypothetical protein